MFLSPLLGSLAKAQAQLAMIRIQVGGRGEGGWGGVRGMCVAAGQWGGAVCGAAGR